VLCLVAIATAGCIPTRNNENDPSNRPSIAMEVTVAGRTSALGGRNEAWRLDATTSRAKHGSLSLEWAISSDGPNLAADVAEWTTVGTDVVVVSTAGNLLHDRLVAISDFSGYDEPGTGLARRWIRLAASDASVSTSETIPITIVNNPPSVNIGIDWRVAPGGQWWTGTGELDNLDAQPWEVVIDATVSDPEGDASLLFTPGYQGAWTVQGQLSAVLDLDGNGRVDSSWIENGGRTLRFPAPLFPTRGEVSLDVWDVRRRENERLSHGIDSARVDVLTSQWILDVYAGDLQRIDAGSFNRDTESYRVVAGDGRRAIIAVRSGGTFLRLVNHRLETIAAPLGPLPLTNPVTRPREAVADGLGAWWFADFEGNLSHMREKDGALVFDVGDTQCPPTPLDTCLGFAGESADFRALTASGTGSVWVLGRSSDFLEDRILEISSSGAVVVEEAAVPGAPLGSAVALVHDGGGPWILSRTADEASLRRRSGAVIETLPDSSSPSVVPIGAYWDSRADAIVVLTGDPNAAKSRLYRREANGTWTFGVVARGYRVFPDPSGDALLGRSTGADESGGLLRVDSRTFLERETHLGFTPEGMVVFDGGSVLFGTSAEGPMEWVEAGARPEHPVFADVVLPPVTGDVHGIALDPVTGQIWLARPDLDVVQRFGPDGELLSTTPLLEDAVRLHLSIDAVTRTAWLASGPIVSGSGRLHRFAIDAEVYEMPVVELVAEVAPVEQLGGIAALPGGAGVCVGGHLDSTRRAGFVWRPATGDIEVSAPDAGTIVAPHRAFAHPRDGSCWFFDENTSSAAPTTGAARFAQGGATESLAWPDPQFNNEYATGIADIASPDLVLAITRHDGFTFPWLGLYSPGNPAYQTSATFPALDAPPLFEPTEFRKSLSGDAFYRHYFVGIEGGDSPVIRLDSSGQEVGRFTGPREVISVCR